MCPGHEHGSDVRWLPFIERPPEGEADISVVAFRSMRWTRVTK